MRSRRELGAWGEPAGERLLRGDDSVHVWQVAVSAFEDHPLDESFLDSEERARADAFRFEDDRRRFIVSHVALRTLLSRYAGEPPEHLRFERSEQGKPELRPNPRSIEFNLAHSGDWICLAVTVGRHVGVDIEKVIELPDLEQLVHRCLCERELTDLRTLDSPARLLAFYRIWTAKEAYAKCLGIGLALPLQQICADWVSFPGGESFTVTGDTVSTNGGIDGRILDTDSGYVGALAVQGGIGRMSNRICSADALCSEEMG